MTQHAHTHVALILSLIIVQSCGRKQRNLFCFEERNNRPKIYQLSLPCPYGIKIFHKKDGSKELVWSDCDIDQKKLPIIFLGYYIYEVTSRNTLSRNPYNQELLCKNYLYIAPYDKNFPERISIRAVFTVDNILYYSPYSKIISIQ